MNCDHFSTRELQRDPIYSTTWWKHQHPSRARDLRVQETVKRTGNPRPRPERREHNRMSRETGQKSLTREKQTNVRRRIIEAGAEVCFNEARLADGRRGQRPRESSVPGQKGLQGNWAGTSFLKSFSALKSSQFNWESLTVYTAPNVPDNTEPGQVSLSNNTN